MPEPQKTGEHEYELMPVSPLRKLEKRLERLEADTGANPTEFYREMVDIIRMNQQLVDELAKANDALRIEISKLPAKIEKLIDHLDEIVAFIKAAAAEEGPASPEATKPLMEKVDQLVQINKKIADSHQALLSALEEMNQKLRRPPPPPFALKGPLPPLPPLPAAKPLLKLPAK